MCTSRVLNAHPEGMLDRDQRTTVTTETKSVPCDCAAECTSEFISFCSCVGSCKKVGVSIENSSKPVCLICCGFNWPKQRKNSDRNARKSFKLTNYKQPSELIYLNCFTSNVSIRVLYGSS